MFDNLANALDVHPAHPADRLRHAMMAHATQAISPASLVLAWADWGLHLGMYQGKQLELAAKGADKWARLGQWAWRELRGEDPEPCIAPLPHDKRFNDPEWQEWPFSLFYQSFLLQQQWWHVATTDVRGIRPHDQNLVHFMSRQMLDVFAPSNFLATNPKVLRATMETGGANLRQGFEYWAEDVRRFVEGAPPRGTEAFPVGEKLAITPGKVVYRNRLMELIQYAPATKTVKPEPILFIPAWIMKYYILDLQPQDSLVRWLVDQGYTVFMVSWKNPGPEERDVAFDDYRRLGIMAALDAVGAILPQRKVHAVGYCIGGTLLTVAAAAMAREDDDRLATVTTFAAQTDFSDPGELGLFVDPSQAAYLEDLMWEQGYLGGARLRGLFFFLKSLDLIWSRYIREYLLGEQRSTFDLMAWNADTTNLPYRMHSEYLRRFYLNNDLAQGNFEVEDEPVAVMDIRVPIFAVATTRDHIAPWESVYKIIRLSRTEVTFVLTAGGHNVGVVNPPDQNRYRFQIHTSKPSDKYLSPQAFTEREDWHDGSWWPRWELWLAEHSGKAVAPPRLGAPRKGYPALTDAPGTYVFESARIG